MNRRGFFGLLAGAAVVPLVAVPELDLGRRIFLPPRGGWLARGNTLLSADMLAREMLKIFTVQAQFIADINRDYDPSFARVTLRTEDRIRIGDRITIEGVRAT